MQWLAGKGIDLIRGTGKLAGPGVVEVDGVRHTARHVVVATGSDPVIPPVPGLRELDGVWTNREVTGMKAVPRRLLIQGGGPVGAEMAQAVRRLGASRRTSSASRARPTTRPSQTWSTPTRKPPRSAPPNPRSA